MACLYELLQVSPKASPAVIKAAYRCLAQQFHPDKNPGNREAGELLSVINRAYAVLADPLLRARYDAQAGIARTERRGSGRTLAPATPEGRTNAPKMRPFAFRAVS